MRPVGAAAAAALPLLHNAPVYGFRVEPSRLRRVHTARNITLPKPRLPPPKWVTVRHYRLLYCNPAKEHGTESNRFSLVGADWFKQKMVYDAVYLRALFHPRCLEFRVWVVNPKP